MDDLYSSNLAPDGESAIASAGSDARYRSGSNSMASTFLARSKLKSGPEMAQMLPWDSQK